MTGNRNCSQDPPFVFARSLFRFTNSAGNAGINVGTDLLVIGGTGAVAGLPFGPQGSAPGVAIAAGGVAVNTVSSSVSFVSGLALLALGDQRTGVGTIFDAAGGRFLQRVPDQFSPFTDQAIGQGRENFINFVDNINGVPNELLNCNQ